MIRWMPKHLLRFHLFAAALLWTAAPLYAAPETALADYVRAADDSFAWQVRQTRAMFGSDVVELSLTSQTWRGITWRHQLFVVKPPRMRHPDRMVLVIAGGRWRDAYLRPPDTNARLPGAAAMVGTAAQRFGSPVAVLLQVPFQPIFGGKTEDQIIAHTFDRYLDTGDETWPVLLPMVNSAVRAMDALQAHAKQAWDLDVANFTVTGASKRGWTTWLTGAVDPRVDAIAPMVIDMLNLGEQMRHQVTAWGAYSPSIHDYTRLNIQQRMDTDRGRALCRIVDPFTYRDALTMPKIIVLGTNDPFWPVDALRHYWAAMPGPKFVCQVPNAGHGLGSSLPHIVGSIAAVHHFAAGSLAMPDLTWRFDRADNRMALTLECDQSARVLTWFARSPTRDFRQAKWVSRSARRDGETYRAEWPIPAAGHGAAFAEIRLNDAGAPYHLATPVEVFGAAAAIAP